MVKEPFAFALVTFVGVGVVGSIFAAWGAGRKYGKMEVLRQEAKQIQDKLDAVMQMDTPLRRQEYEIAEKLFKENYSVRWQDYVPKKEIKR